MSSVHKRPDKHLTEKAHSDEPRGAEQYQLNVRMPASASLADFNHTAQSGVISFVEQLINGQLDQLLCFGADQTGKSHLCYAAVRAAKKSGLSACVFQLASNDTSVLQTDTGMFDLIALDDIDQVFQTPAEDLLFDFMNRAKSLGQRLLLSSQDAQFNCQILDLRSRLMQGARFELPVMSTFEERMDFIEQTAKLRHLKFSNRLCRLIAKEGPETSGAMTHLVLEVELILAGQPFKKLSANQVKQIERVIAQSC